MTAFYILFSVGVIAAWFLMSWLYKPAGRFFYRIFKDAKDNMSDRESIPNDDLEKEVGSDSGDMKNK